MSRRCPHCGKLVSDEYDICPNCGRAIAQAEPAENKRPRDIFTAGKDRDVRKETERPTCDARDGAEKKAERSRPAGHSGRRIAGLIIFLVLFPAIVYAVWLGITGIRYINLGQTLYVNLNSYLEIKTDGYNTRGTAYYYLDVDRMKLDYGEQLKLKDGSEDSGSKDPWAVLTEDYIGGKLDRTENLSNGDEVYFTWDIDESEVEESFNAELTYEDRSFIINGLTELTTIEPFDRVSVYYTGIAPAGKAVMNVYEENYMEDLVEFNIDRTTGLSDGDKVTVTWKDKESAEKTDEELLKHGCILDRSVQSKTYTADLHISYVTSLDELTQNQELMKEYTAAGEDKVCSHDEEDQFFFSVKAKSCEYIGCEFYQTKDYAAAAEKRDAGDYSFSMNSLYLLYRVTLDITGDDGTEAETVIYQAARLNNLTSKSGAIYNDPDSLFCSGSLNFMTLEGLSYEIGLSGYESLGELDRTIQQDNVNSLRETDIEELF